MITKSKIRLILVLVAFAIILYACGDEEDVKVRMVTQLNMSKFDFESENLTVTLEDALKEITPNLDLPSGSRVKLLFGSPYPQARESKVKGFWTKTNSRVSLWQDTFKICVDLNENDICDFFENYDFNQERCKSTGYLWTDKDATFETFFDNCCGDDTEEFGIVGQDASVACCNQKDSCVVGGECFDSKQCNTQGQYCNTGVFEKIDGNLDQVDDRCVNFIACNLGTNVAEPCRDEWQCSQWSNCTDIKSSRTRNCIDLNNCGTNYNKPDPFETQSCLQLLSCIDKDNDGYGKNCFTNITNVITFKENECNDDNNQINPNSTEICDGTDNNCDGTTDENCPCIHGQTRSCGSQVGDCSKGIQICQRGLFSVCFSGSNAVFEICDDGLDNDCDGFTDENCPCQNNTTKECGKNIGICKKGTQKCVSGVLTVCEGSVESSPEICDDGLDNDCDGKVDPFDENCNPNLITDTSKENSCTDKKCNNQETCLKDNTKPADCGGPCPKCPGDPEIPITVTQQPPRRNTEVTEPEVKEIPAKEEPQVNPFSRLIVIIIITVLVLLGIIVAFHKRIKAKINNIKTESNQKSSQQKLFKPLSPVIKKRESKVEKELEKSFEEAEKTLKD